MDFWRIIDKARNESEGAQEIQYEVIFSELEKCSPEEIFDFQIQLDGYMAKAYRWDLWGAAFIINGGCSDDSFFYFCLWLISCGKKSRRGQVDNRLLLEGAFLMVENQPVPFFYLLWI